MTWLGEGYLYKRIYRREIVFPYANNYFVINTDSKLLLNKLSLYYGEMFCENSKNV